MCHSWDAHVAPGEGFVSLMKWLCQEIHLSFHESQWSMSSDGHIRLGWDDLCPSHTGYFIQFNKIFHSLVQVWCMVLKLMGPLASGSGHLDHSFSDPHLFLKLQQWSIILDSFPKHCPAGLSPLLSMLPRWCLQFVESYNEILGIWRLYLT